MRRGPPFAGFWLQRRFRSELDVTRHEVLRSRVRSGGVRITKVGFGFLLFGLVLLVAASNTGNNGLYLVLAVMAGMLASAHLIGAVNVRGLAVGVRPPGEVYANRPTRFSIEVTNRSRWFARRLLLVSLRRDDGTIGTESRRRTAPLLVGWLRAAETTGGDVEVILRRRGRFRRATIEMSSLFPIGFFHKIMRRAVALDLLVYPEIFPPTALLPRQRGGVGEESSPRRGRGHELAGLRPFRAGDDPRSIHWKQTARTGRFVFKESATEEARRLSVVFDNAAGALDGSARQRFERLVSEAATAAVHAIDRGWEVELVTRDQTLAYASGQAQRRRMLETLALIEPVEADATVLAPSSTYVQQLRLAMDSPAAPREEAVA